MSKVFLAIEDYCIDGYPIKVVRDDLFPYVGGGSKARKAMGYESFLRQSGYNAVVTCGGIQSNHNRAIALMSARNGWKCHLCIQGTQDRFDAEKGNALLCRLSGADCELIDVAETASAMDKAMQQFHDNGLNPYYIHGGGHDLPGGTCFVDAVSDFKERCDDIGYKPDYIFLASGTGSTQAGIVAGLEMVGWGDVTVVGISVARELERGRQVIQDFLRMLCLHYGLDNDLSERVVFNADYLYGGYEAYSLQMKEYLEKVMRETGLIFDTTYSGKGFYGMMEIIKRGALADKNNVFWHTGGLMNIMN